MGKVPLPQPRGKTISSTSWTNLVPRAHVPFGQHQDTELWNNQFPETKILGLLASQRMRCLLYTSDAADE